MLVRQLISLNKHSAALRTGSSGQEWPAGDEDEDEDEDEAKALR